MAKQHIHPDDLSPSQLGTATHHVLERSLRGKISPHQLIGKVVMADWGSEDEHARLSPSGAHRWLACPGMLRIIGPQPPREGAETTVTQQMANSAEVACDAVRPILSKAIAFGIEDRVTIPVTGEFGTVDIWALVKDYLDYQGLVLYVIDYKNGRHAVKAKRNPQMMLYSQGVLSKTLHWHRGANIRVQNTIIQPNAVMAEPVDTWGTTKAAIVGWCRDIVAPTVDTIEAGKGALIPGDHCTNCKVNDCPARARMGAEACKMTWKEFIVPKSNPAPEDVVRRMTPAELAGAVNRVKLLRGLADALEEEAMRRLIKNPKALPGVKVVEGQSRRTWKDKDLTVATFRKMNIPVDDYMPRSLVGIGEGAKLLPKSKRDAVMAKLTTRPHGRPVLAPSTDERPAINGNAAIDFRDDIDDTVL